MLLGAERIDENSGPEEPAERISAAALKGASLGLAAASSSHEKDREHVGEELQVHTHPHRLLHLLTRFETAANEHMYTDFTLPSSVWRFPMSRIS